MIVSATVSGTLRAFCRHLVLSMITAAILAACSEPQVARVENGFSYVSPAPVLADVRLMRERLYERVVAAGADTLRRFEYPANMDDPRWIEQTLVGFDENKYAVWCYDTATMLAALYRAAGYESVTISVGIEGGYLTHAGTLVKVDGEWYYQDAYFNFEIPIPFFEAISAVRRGEPLPHAVTLDAVRPLRVRAPSNATHFEGQPNCEPLDDEYLCDVRFTTAGFREERMWADTFLLQGTLGAPDNLAGLFLFPFAVFDGQGYYTDHPLLDQYREASGCFGGLAPSCSVVTTQSAN